MQEEGEPDENETDWTDEDWEDEEWQPHKPKSAQDIWESHTTPPLPYTSNYQTEQEKDSAEYALLAGSYQTKSGHPKTRSPYLMIKPLA